MDTGYKDSHLKLEDVPIIDGQCCVNLATPTTSGKSTLRDDKHFRLQNYWILCTRYKFIFLICTLFAVLITCLTISMVYVIRESDYVHPETRIDQVNKIQQSISAESFLGDTKDDERNGNLSSDNVNLLYYDDALNDIHRKVYSMLSKIDGNRLKRETPAQPSLCKRNVDHCTAVIESMRQIASIVDGSMPRIQALSKNLTHDAQQTKSKLEELLECLACRKLQAKNDSIALVDEDNADLNNTKYLVHDHSGNAQIQDNVNAVINLLNDDDRREKTTDSSVVFMEETSAGSQGDGDGVEAVDRSNSSSIVDHRGGNLNGSGSEINSSSSDAGTIGHGMVPPETNAIDETTIYQTDGTIDVVVRDKNQTASTVDVIKEVQGYGVREILNDTVHPSDQGQAENEGAMPANGTTNTRTMEHHLNSERRIMSNPQFQPKGNVEPAQMIIPTAETIKSTQQLQLTPTMSWMPYQVCYYGPQTNGYGKPGSAPQVTFPASSPSAPYPVSMPQQRPNYQNSANQPAASQSPNYVQVQAQSVQFLPMQPYPGNSPMPFGQRIGPTGPGMQNFPVFPGQQSPSSGAGGSAKTPYYCTYIPAPTFQFPAVPGVSEYQRSGGANGDDKEEQRAVFNKNGWNLQGPWQPGFPRVCPYNSRLCADGGRCVSRSQWCDGHVDCNDASDETTCSCRDRISKERLCDGYFDCPHGEDELGCFGCPKTSFSCDDWNKRYYATDNCVPLAQRCDGIKQCNNGKDEMDCNMLTPTYIEGKNVFVVGNVEGYLHKNFRGQWYPVCTPSFEWAVDACTSEIGTEMSGKPEIKVHTIPDTAYRGPYLADENGQTKLLPSCMNNAIYVRCPQMSCGTRVLSQQDTLRPFNTYEDEEQLLRKYRDSENGKNENKTGKVEATLRDGNLNSELKKDNDTMVGAQLRVVGGRASHPKAWPFLVAIYKDGNFHCGGVILNELWILTAAHCLDRYSGHYYEVQAGILRRFSFSPMAQSRKARFIIMHPEYESKSMKNDIGMIKLDEALHFNRWLRPICLPNANFLGAMWRKNPEPDSTCLAIGWGAMREQGPDPDHLREVEVPILPRCKYPTDQNEATICAGYPQGGRDACQGDSGGPLICKNPYLESQWYVAGIVSHGEGCARPNEPGVYTKVSNYVDWIQKISSGQGIPPASLTRVPLERCPGFSCEGGLGKCLPVEKRCNRIVDCLDGEDEVNCPGQTDYSLFRKSDSDSEFIASIVDGNSTGEIGVTTSDKNSLPILKEKEKIETESGSDENGKITSDADNTNANKSVITNPPPVIFTCSRLIQTIPIVKRCNRIFDCEDGTDEVNCTCKDFLSNVRPTAICDGYLDCADKTDEENCNICNEGEFLCGRSRFCIPLFKKCDGAFDCPLKEDELDCFTLTNGQYAYMDADDRPYSYMEGVFTRYRNGKWRPVCHRPRLDDENQSTSTLIGKNMCQYFGFGGLQSSKETIVRDAEVETIPWIKENATSYEYPSEEIAPNEEDKTCPGLYIRCRPVLNSSLSTHQLVDPRTGSSTYQWPWLAAIFVDGSYRCTATLLDLEWLLSTADCVKDVRSENNYMTAVLGYGPSYRYVDGPNQQVSFIDRVQIVNNSVSAVLHMKTPANVTRYVRPLFMEKKIYPATREDICVAFGTKENFETKSIFMRPVLQDCQSCHRCFGDTPISECSNNETSDWSGTVFCRGPKGWYPAAAFQQEDGACNFRNSPTITSIDYINPYLTHAMEDNSRPTIEPPCDGFRCKIGDCISQNQVCDGVENCRDAADEDPEYCQRIHENCENSVDGCECERSMMRCGNGECIDKSAFCDGNVDCSDGTDEPIRCTCAEYLKLTAPERLCDGVRHCFDKTDEAPDVCPCKDTSFTCKTSTGNVTCIPQDFICDGERDCTNGEDEVECRMVQRYATDRPGTGEVIRRTYGVWHTECFANPITSDGVASSLCKASGYSDGSVSNDTRSMDAPLLPSRDPFYMVRLNQWTWITMRDDKPLITLERSKDTCYRAMVNCV